MMKRLCSFVLCGALLAGSAAASWPAWAESARLWGESAAISQTFLAEPDTIMTRGMAAQLLYEAQGKPAVSGACPFTDVSAAYADAVTWAAQENIIAGTGEGLYTPDRAITREEFAAILYRYADALPVPMQGMQRYRDNALVSDWALTSVSWCLQTGILSGRSADLLAPADHITTAEALQMLKQTSNLPDVSGLSEDLRVLTATPRPIGSQGEADAAAYLKGRFEEMGYTVTLQPYTNAQGQTGTNVIAVKSADKPNADIFILSAHHDSVPTAYGANDNASGVAALLYTANALQNLPTDTEIRFISFTDEENGKNGSRAYTAGLTADEKSRMIGNIQFDMLGGLGSEGTLLCTTDGAANWITDLLQTKDTSLTRAIETASDHTSFQLAGIPACLIMQNGRGYLYHSIGDTAQALNLYAIARSADTVLSAIEEVISPSTASYQALAREQGDGYVYRQTRQNVIYFGSSLTDTEAYIGAAGQLADSYEITGDGWTDVYDSYLYSMRWFDGDTPIHTYYQYRNGFLESILLRPEETGYTFDQIRNLMTAMYGSPTVENAEHVDWADPIYSKYLSLSTDEKGCKVTVSNYSAGITNILSSYPVKDGEADISDPNDQAVWTFLCSILPPESRQKIAELNLFTDGYSNVLAYTSPIQQGDVTDNTRFSLNIDYYDVYDENGTPRDWSKLTYTILHEYGHVLLEDETQIDLTIGENTHDPAGFIEGSFRKAFYERFWADLGDSAVTDYEKNPTNYVSRYGANYFHEDIADTFAVFLLSDKPQGNTIAEEKLRFFWDSPQMTALRSKIRQNLGLERSGS